jgi:fermentation-respiration switch protein FrsA (DUF1100 family)
MRGLRFLASLLWIALGATGCNGLVYFPSRHLYAVPRAAHRDVVFEAEDGVELHGWYFPPANGVVPRATIVQFHGNAGNITSHYRSLAWVVDDGYAFFTFDYRGYGRSGGVPTRRGVYLDALAALDWALSDAPRGTLARDVVLHGQSLGGAVLLRALADIEDRQRIRAVVIESSFASYQEAAAGVLYRTPLLAPFTGFAYALTNDDYAPAAYVAGVSPIPLLVIHDVFDDVVPLGHGASLYRLGAAPKRFWVTHRGGHVRSTDDLDLRRALLAWLETPQSAAK